MLRRPGEQSPRAGSVQSPDGGWARNEDGDRVRMMMIHIVIGHRSEEARRDGAFPQIRESGGERRIIGLKESGCEQEGMVRREGGAKRTEVIKVIGLEESTTTEMEGRNRPH